MQRRGRRAHRLTQRPPGNLLSGGWGARPRRGCQAGKEAFVARKTLGVALVGAVAALFYEIGASEDRERDATERARRRDGHGP